MKNKIVVYIAVAALALSVYSSFINVKPISVDGANLLGWIIGVLAILVTVLIGWQIYKAIEIDSMVRRRIGKAKEELTREMEGKIISVQSSLHLNMFFASLNFGNYDDAVSRLISTISMVNNELADSLCVKAMKIFSDKKIKLTVGTKKYAYVMADKLPKLSSIISLLEFVEQAERVD